MTKPKLTFIFFFANFDYRHPKKKQTSKKRKKRITYTIRTKRGLQSLDMFYTTPCQLFQTTFFNIVKL